MQIQLEHIIPLPLSEKDLSSSDIWNKEVLFNSGESIHIHAPSGTGKSTLIHILYGLRKDFTGSILYKNKKLKHTHTTLSELRKNKVSVVFQDMRLFSSLTGWENLSLKNHLTHFVPEETIKGMMIQLGVDHLAEKIAKTMSLGEQQRIAIIRSLLQPFDWLLLDEPFSHLDQNNIEKAKQLITETCKKNNAGMCMASLGETYGLTYDRSLNL